MNFIYEINNFRIPFKEEAKLEEILRKNFHIPSSQILKIEILKKSLDARQNKKNIFYQYHLQVFSESNLKTHSQLIQRATPIIKNKLKIDKAAYHGPTPIIVGYGPSGMFATYILTLAGIRCRVIEQGQTVGDRQKNINKLWKHQEMNPYSNVQFGEGGAGFFSDGKLGTRIKSPYIPFVYEAFHRFGAKDSLLYDNKPHLGTDKLKGILKNFRAFLQDQGVEFHFEEKALDFKMNGRAISGLITDKSTYDTDTIFLCTGHSCRDIYRLLHKHHIAMQQKTFAVGFRVEHQQSIINQNQYGPYFQNLDLPSADYQLAHQAKNNEGGTYSFCMCPGGMVVLAASDHQSIVTNGMSLSNRSGKFANAAIVTNIPSDLLSNELFSGMDFQKTMEKKAFQMTQSYYAPAQLIADFLENKVSENLPKTSFLPGIKSVNLRELYPQSITDRIHDALLFFNDKLKGFSSGVLIGPETRTSSPIQIIRNPDTLETTTVKGLVPLGEGAGAAGGITSAAVEGCKGALAWLEKIKISE